MIDVEKLTKNDIGRRVKNLVLEYYGGNSVGVIRAVVNGEVYVQYVGDPHRNTFTTKMTTSGKRLVFLHVRCNFCGDFTGIERGEVLDESDVYCSNECRYEAETGHTGAEY